MCVVRGLRLKVACCWVATKVNHKISPANYLLFSCRKHLYENNKKNINKNKHQSFKYFSFYYIKQHGYEIARITPPKAKY